MAMIETQVIESGVWNADHHNGILKEMNGARYELHTACGMRFNVFHFYITPTDSMGQRIGTIEKKECLGCEIEINKWGFPLYQGHFIFTSYEMACRAAND